METKIAVVDDEKTIRETVRFALEKEGHSVETYSDGYLAWESFQNSIPDIVILDIIMPRMDGLELCRKIRTVNELVPVIFLSSKDDEFDRVLGLGIGGDDYICKPFSMRELVARIGVMVRRMRLSRVETPEEDIIVAGNLHLDTKRYTASWHGNELPLTITEYLLLQSIARYPGHIKTRDMLINEVYPENSYVNDRTIDSHIKRLRKKIQSIDPEFNCIQTVYSMGYSYKLEK
jgi:two-component system response regulator ChvI